MRKFSPVNVWKMSTEIFDVLLLVAVIEDKVFCAHDGLSPQAEKIDDIKQINRIKEIPHDPMSDILWIIPVVEGFSVSPSSDEFLFGAEEIRKKNNNLSHYF